MMRCGVYVITFAPGRQYVGSSRDIDGRWRIHRSILSRGYAKGSKLQNCWNKYPGPRFDVLIMCREDDLLLYEQIAIDALKPWCNVLQIAGRSSGFHFNHTPEAKAAIGRAALGRVWSDASRLKNSLSNIGKHAEHIATPEMRRKMSIAHKRRMEDPLVRAHLSTINLGKGPSSEARARGVAINQRKFTCRVSDAYVAMLDGNKPGQALRHAMRLQNRGV